MNKKALTAIFYTIPIPLNVWTGYELGTQHYLFSGFLIVISMVIEYIAVTFWIEAQTDELNRK